MSERSERISGLSAPTARLDRVQDVRFGVTLDDPYRWMEDPAGPELDAWLDAQADYCRSVVESLPHRQPLLDRIRSLTGAYESLFDFTLAGDRVFHLRQGDDGPPALVVREGGAPRALFDPAVDGCGYAAVDWYVPSPDGRYVACAVSQGGAEDARMSVLDVETALPVGEPVPVGDGFLGWLDAGRSFVYHRHRAPAADTPPYERLLDSRSYLHRLGDDPDRDVTVLARGLNPRLTIMPADRPYLVVPPGRDWAIALIAHAAVGAWAAEQLGDCTIYVAPRAELSRPASCGWVRVAGPADGVNAFTATADTLYLACHRGAPRGQVLAVPFADPDLARARLVVPTGQRAVDALAVAGDHLLVRDLDGGIGRLRRVPLAGGEPADVALPIEGTIAGWASQPDRSQALLVLASWTGPPRAYHLDAGTGELADTGWMPPSPVDFSGVRAERLMAPARDGTLIPVSLVHRAGLVRDGTNPTLMNAGGSYGVTLGARFQPEMLAWYERGGVLATAHVRGGGEYGREWHDAGRGPNQENTITDFIDCADFLVAQGYTSPHRLAGTGASAGAIPCGGAMVRRPDLWAAVVLKVPVTNATRIEFSENGPANIPEFGSVTTESGLHSQLINDSYLRVVDGTPYPAVPLTTGRNDTRVPLWQAGKMTARLQAATSSGRPVLLRIDEHAGHGVGSRRDQQDAFLADQLAFLLDAFGD